MTPMYRQGDVLLVKVDAVLLEGATREPSPGERIVLAEGEATGHAHTVDGAHAEAFVCGEARILNVTEETLLTHQEHAAISLRPGVYRVIRQREYLPQNDGDIPYVCD